MLQSIHLFVRVINVESFRTSLKGMPSRRLMVKEESKKQNKTKTITRNRKRYWCQWRLRMSSVSLEGKPENIGQWVDITEMIWTSAPYESKILFGANSLYVVYRKVSRKIQFGIEIRSVRARPQVGNKGYTKGHHMRQTDLGKTYGARCDGVKPSLHHRKSGVIWFD